MTKIFILMTYTITQCLKFVSDCVCVAVCVRVCLQEGCQPQKRVLGYICEREGCNEKDQERVSKRNRERMTVETERKVRFVRDC